MSFASPGLLWLLLVAPVLVAVYFWILRRTRSTLYPNLAIVREAIVPGTRLRRHIPPLLMLLALMALLVAVARPSTSICSGPDSVHRAARATPTHSPSGR